MELKRNKRLLSIAKGVLWPMIQNTSNIEYDIHDDALALMALKNSKKYHPAAAGEAVPSILYAPTHKSLWETVGIPYAIDHFSKDTPFTIMGDNLFKNSGWKESIIKYILTNTGGIIINRSERTSALFLKKTIKKILKSGNDVMVFPEGTRSRTGMINNFWSASFQGAINASKKKEVYVIPTNVDYSEVLESKDLVREKKPYSFRLNHMGKWAKSPLGNIYISMDKPILVTPENNRSNLCEIVRDSCMNLVKVLPVNVVSESIVRSFSEPGEAILRNQIYSNIESVISELQHKSDKFAGFDSNTDPEILIKMSEPAINVNRFLTSELYSKSKLYSNYIRHYLPKQ